MIDVIWCDMMRCNVMAGWGNARKEVEVYDVSCLPKVERIQCRLSGSARYFKYGEESTLPEAAKIRLLV